LTKIDFSNNTILIRENSSIFSLISKKTILKEINLKDNFIPKTIRANLIQLANERKIKLLI
jgi:hypothetical protein